MLQLNRHYSNIVGTGRSRVVRFSHSSVKEHLTSEPRYFRSRYHIALKPAHTILEQACLSGVLLRLGDPILYYFAVRQYGYQGLYQFKRLSTPGANIPLNYAALCGWLSESRGSS